LSTSSEPRTAALPIDADSIASTPAPLAAELEAAAPGGFELGALVARLRRWSGILAAFAGAQALVQAATLAAGLILVNVLPVEEFAVYTFASSMLVTLAFATDLGGSSALLHFFHRSRAGEVDFDLHAAAVASLRGRLFLLAAPVAAIALVSWGHGHGRPPLELGVTVALVLAAVALQIPATLALVRLRLEDRFGESYRAEIAGALARLAAVGAMIYAGWLRSLPALATALAGVAVTAWLTRGGTSRAARARDLAPARRSVLRYLAPTLPGAVYFAIQGQFVVWLAAVFGGTTNLAEVGALGRLGLIMGVLGNLTSVVFLPRLAGITDERRFRNRYFAFGAALATVAVAILGAAALVPGAFLALLGPNYRGLHGELLLVVTTAGVTLLGGFAVAVNNARSWNRWQPAAVGVLVAGQIAMVATMSLSTTRGVLLFGLGSAVLGLVLQVATSVAGFVRREAVQW
jgi:hypothetical protein